jgi:hypothetical protein
LAELSNSSTDFNPNEGIYGGLFQAGDPIPKRSQIFIVDR